MLLIGLTGGIGAGKSAVAARLRELGAMVIDADVLAREVVGPGTDGLAEVVAAFGPEVLTAAGELDRAALGRLVFADPDRRAGAGADHPSAGAGPVGRDRWPPRRRTRSWSTTCPCWWRPARPVRTSW